jgi:hypothetical protein
MQRRKTLILAGLAVGALILAPAARSADEHAHHHHGSLCADACAACATSCASCFEHCAGLLSEGKKEHALTMRLCNDCSDVCATAAKLVAGRGPLHLAYCDLCAKACDRCAAECANYPNEPHMVACAKSCRTCAAACRDLVKQSARAN